MCWLGVCVCWCASYWFSLCCSSYRPNEKVSYIFPDFASCESGDHLRCSCFNHVWCIKYLLKSTVKHYLLSWSSFYESIFKYGFGFSVFFQLFISQFQLWVFGEDFTFTWWWLFFSTMYMLECFTVWFTNLLLRILWVRYQLQLQLFSKSWKLFIDSAIHTTTIFDCWNHFIDAGLYLGIKWY